jgi:hypothetical protein
MRRVINSIKVTTLSGFHRLATPLVFSFKVDDTKHPIYLAGISESSKPALRHEMMCSGFVVTGFPIFILGRRSALANCSARPHIASHPPRIHFFRWDWSKNPMVPKTKNAITANTTKCHG